MEKNYFDSTRICQLASELEPKGQRGWKLPNIKRTEDIPIQRSEPLIPSITMAINNHYIKLLSLYLTTVSRIIIGLFTLQSIVWVAAMIAALVPAAGNPPNKCKTNTEHKYNNAHMKNAQMKSAQMQNQRRAQIQQYANEKCKNSKIHQTNAKLAHNTNVHMQNKHKSKNTEQFVRKFRKQHCCLTIAGV